MLGLRRADPPRDRLRRRAAPALHGVRAAFAPEVEGDEVRDLYRGDEYFAAYPGGMVDEDAGPLRDVEARGRLELVRAAAAPPARLLELGAAAGQFLAMARDAGYDVAGIEPTDNGAQTARERHGLEIHNGFVEDVELPAASFDVACAWHVLEHIAPPGPALERVGGWLKPGGKLLLEVPNVASLQARRAGADWALLAPEHHVSHFTPRALGRLLERSGYVVDSIRTVAYTSYLPLTMPLAWASAARNLVDRRGVAVHAAPLAPRAAPGRRRQARLEPRTARQSRGQRRSPTTPAAVSAARKAASRARGPGARPRARGGRGASSSIQRTIGATTRGQA